MKRIALFYDFIFVVLVYRNTDDLKSFFEKLTIKNSKVIVVNAQYEEETDRQFEQIAHDHQADFINIPNKGYGYGNNQGIEHAIQNYQFRYLVVSNADICILNLDVSQLHSTHITAPDIVTLTGKRQNPYLAYHWQWYEDAKYWLYKHNYRRMFKIVAMISRATREFYNLTVRKGYIYSAHGSFFIMPYEIAVRLHPIYDERIFLYKEEECLAHLVRQEHVNIYYDPNIRILHKEDGSTSMMTERKYDLERQSYITFYEAWHK